MWTSSGRQTLLWWPEALTLKHSQILFILLPTQFNSLGQFKTTSKLRITSWFIIHSQCPASCVEAKMRAPRPSAVARIIGHWRAAPAFSSNNELKTINKNIDAQLMESQFFGIQPQLPRFIEVNLRANGKPMWQMHQQCCPYKDCWEDMVVCCMCSHVSCGRLESHHSFHTVKVLQAPAMHAEQNRHTRESWYAGCNGSLKAQSANATCYEDCKLIVWGPGWKVRRGFWGRLEKGFGESSLTKEGVTTGFIGAWKVPKGREGGLKQIWTVSVKDGFKDGCAQTNDNICHPTVQEVKSQG